MGSGFVPALSLPGKWWYGQFRYASLPCAPGNCSPMLWSDLLCLYQSSALDVLDDLLFLFFRHFRFFGFLCLSSIYLRWLLNLCAGSGLLGPWFCLSPYAVCVKLCVDLRLELVAARLVSWNGFYGVMYLIIHAVVSNYAYPIAFLLVLARDYSIHYVALLTLILCCSYLANYNCALISSLGRPAKYPISSMVIRLAPFDFLKHARHVGFHCHYVHFLVNCPCSIGLIYKRMLLFSSACYTLVWCASFEPYLLELFLL